MATTTFPADVVDAICRHMNDDHAEDALLICRTLGGVPDATRAETVGVDSASMQFLAFRDGESVAVAVPFPAPVLERAQVRTAVVALHEQACAAAGVPTRGH